MSGRVINADPLNEKKKIGLQQQVEKLSHQEPNSSSNPLRQKPFLRRAFSESPFSERLLPLLPSVVWSYEGCALFGG